MLRPLQSGKLISQSQVIGLSALNSIAWRDIPWCWQQLSLMFLFWPCSLSHFFFFPFKDQASLPKNTGRRTCLQAILSLFLFWKLVVILECPIRRGSPFIRGNFLGWVLFFLECVLSGSGKKALGFSWGLQDSISHCTFFKRIETYPSFQCASLCLVLLLSCLEA